MIKLITFDNSLFMHLFFSHTQQNNNALQKVLIKFKLMWQGSLKKLEAYIDRLP